MRRVDGLWRRRPPRVDPDWRVESPAKADPRFDRLWARVGGRHGLTIERSAAWVDWRFVVNPFLDYELLLVGDTAGEPAGYAALYRRREGMLVFGYLSDWVVDDTRPGAAAALCAAALRRFEQEGVDVALAYDLAGGPAPYAALALELRRAGPVVRRINKTFIVRDANATGAAQRPQTDWFVTEAFTEGAAL
jgi:hypothetical protein